MASEIGTPVMAASNFSSLNSNDASGAQSPRDSESSQSSLDSGDEAPGVPNAPTVADPSVIVGMACRLPGATSASKLWEVVAEKKDLQRKMPEDRFNVDAFYHPQGINKGTVNILPNRLNSTNDLKTNAKYGYFLDQGLDEFDNEFFRISGKEAAAMDPQQRLLLEVVYEALEDGKPP